VLQVSPSLQDSLEVVAFKCSFFDAKGDGWVEFVAEKLLDIGVMTLRDFVLSVLNVNGMLENNVHRRGLHQATLNMMLSEVYDVMWESEAGKEELVLLEVPVEDPAAE
jgi:hypothetical protein